MGKIFKNSIFGGFNKKQVITYIDGLMKKHEGDMSNAKAKFDRLQEEYDKLTEKHSEIEAQNTVLTARTEELMAQNAEEEAKCQAIHKKLDSVSAEHAQLKEHVADIEAEARKRASRSLVAKISSKIEENPQIVHELDVVEKKTDEIWDNFKAKLTDITEAFNDLISGINASEKAEIHPAAEKKLLSIKEILERVRRIGEKI